MKLLARMAALAVLISLAVSFTPVGAYGHHHPPPTTTTVPTSTTTFPTTTTNPLCGTWPLRIVGTSLTTNCGSRYRVSGVAQYWYAYDDGGSPDPAMAATSAAFYANRGAWFAYMESQGIDTVRIGLGAYEFDNQTYLSQSSYITELGNLLSSAAADNLTVELCNWDSMGDGAGWPYDYTLWHPFWSDLKTTIQAHTNVIIEPFNEPNSVSESAWVSTTKSEVAWWRTWYSGVLTVDTDNYSDDFTPSYISQIVGTNVLFSIHSYADEWASAAQGFTSGTYSGSTTNAQQFDQWYTDYATTYPMLIDETGNVNNTDYNAETSPASGCCWNWLTQFHSSMAADTVTRGLNGEIAFAFSWSQGDCMITYCYGNSPQGSATAPVWNGMWGQIFENYYVRNL